MKLKNITIGVRDLKTGLQSLAEDVKAIESGGRVRARKPGVYFVDLAAIQSVLTPRRIELLRVIHKERPQSIYQLAQMTQRELKNVQDDVHLLARIGLLQLSKSRAPRRNLVPRVDYDELNLRVSLV